MGYVKLGVELAFVREEYFVTFDKLVKTWWVAKN